MNIIAREYQEYDAEEISHIVRRNLFEVNITDYSEEEIEKQVEKFKQEDIIRKFKTRITYVATHKGMVIGTASISNNFSRDKSIFTRIS